MFSNNLMGLLRKFKVDLVFRLGGGFMLSLLVIRLLKDWNSCVFFLFFMFLLS